MKPTERIYKIEDLLNEHGFLSFQAIQHALEVSRATLKRDLAELRDRYHMPIVYDREAGGYRIDRQSKPVGPVQYELPGLWFSAQEIHALLTMHRLIANLDSGGLLGPHIQPLMQRMNRLLGAADNPAEEVVKRIRLVTVGAREFQLDHFQRVGSALLRRKRLMIDYHARSTDAVRRVEVLDRPAIDVEEERLDAVLGSGYGIFSGEEVKWATLRFSPKLARWVATERWHQDQETRELEDGRFELRLPYSEDTELVMDILRYGADCEVVEPTELRMKVAAALREALRGY